MADLDNPFREVTPLIPHRPPFQFIQSFRMLETDSAIGQGLFEENSLGVTGKVVLETTLIEALAQTIAALSGMTSKESSPTIGYLVAIQRFEFFGPVSSGLTVEFYARMNEQWGDYHMASGEIKQRGEIKAKGHLRFYIPKQSLRETRDIQT